MKKKKKLKETLMSAVMMLVFVAIGGVCGVFIAKYLDRSATAGRSFGEELFALALLFLGMYAAIFLQISIHEAGHLVFGLLSGYKFCSFRIGNLVWVKSGEKIRFKKMSVAGTGGQCLMDPPEIKDGKIPYVLYNLGGSIMNLIASALCLGAYFLLKDVPVAPVLLMMLVVIGTAFALVNGVPMRLGTVDNDGYNALSLGKTPEALRSFWVQIKANTAQTEGVRLKDMPDEWFYLPEEKKMKNSMVATMGVFYASRLIDEGKYQEADSCIEKLLDMESGIVGVHRSLLVCERIFCGLIFGKSTEEVNEMLTKEQKKFMRAMRKYLSVLRTEFSYALLAERNLEKAGKIKKEFFKAAQKSPYPADVESEKEHLKYVERVFAELK